MTMRSAMAAVHRWFDAPDHQPFDVEVGTDITGHSSNRERLMNHGGKLSASHKANPFFCLPEWRRAKRSGERLVNVKGILTEPCSNLVSRRPDAQDVAVAVHPHVHDLSCASLIIVSDMDGNAMSILAERHRCNRVEARPINIHRIVIAMPSPKSKATTGYIETSTDSPGTGGGSIAPERGHFGAEKTVRKST